jgi:hypothetical protein
VSSAKILASSSIAAVITYIFVNWIPFSAPIRLVLGVVLFALVFLAAALPTGTINRNDIANIRQIVGGLGPLRKPLGIVLDLLEKFMPKPKKQEAEQS